jgi:hypothetical protein
VEQVVAVDQDTHFMLSCQTLGTGDVHVNRRRGWVVVC